MPRSPDDNVLVVLSVPLYPDPDQDRVLTEVHTALIRVDQALRHPGRRPSIEDALDLHAPGLPADLRPAALCVFRARLNRRDETSIGIPFDALLSPLPPYLLHSPVLPGPVIADLWRLPLGLGAVLAREAEGASAQLAAQLQRLHQADTAGDPLAPGQLHDLVTRSGIRAAFAPSHLSGVLVPEPVLKRVWPHLARYVTVLRQQSPDGRPGWQVRFSFRVRPDWLPQAKNADTVGVDVGVHRAVTWADSQGHGHLFACSRPTDGWRPPVDTVEFAHRLADAHLRRNEFERLSGPLDQTLRRLLGYQVIGVEATKWIDMANKDPLGQGVVRAMGMTGITDLIPWLRALGNVTGTRVVPVPAEGSSITCSVCGRVGQRRRLEFRCPHCGLIADADSNAARNHRLWALGHRRDLGVNRP